ncbi:MAG: type II toxin-antitoxin system ParD family antitoxin [Cyanobacteriota bacterium]
MANSANASIVAKEFGPGRHRHDDERQPLAPAGGDGESEGGFRAYTSASEVVREALRLMEHQDQLRDLQLQELRRAIQAGLDSGEPVAWIPEAIKAAGRQRLRAQVDAKPGV